MNRHLIAAGLGTAIAMAGAGAAAAETSASTVGPVVVGWWSATNVSSALPAVAPPDVGAEDLYVAGANALPGLPGATGAGQSAIAALRYQLPSGSTASRLRLRLAGTHPPAVTLTACRALRPFETVYGGSWDDAPTYDCDQAGTARLDPEGQVLIDGVDRLRVGRELAVVLVPGPLDRVVVAAPDARTLTVTGGAASTPAPQPPLPPAPPVAPSGTAPLAGGSVPGGPAPVGALPGAVGPAVQAPALAPAGAPSAAAAAPVVAAPALAPAAALPDRPWPALLATLVLALLAFVPLVRPRGDAVGAGAAGLRGVGRFRSERSGTVPDLA